MPFNSPLYKNLHTRHTNTHQTIYFTTKACTHQINESAKWSKQITSDTTLITNSSLTHVSYTFPNKFLKKKRILLIKWRAKYLHATPKLLLFCYCYRILTILFGSLYTITRLFWSSQAFEFHQMFLINFWWWCVWKGRDQNNNGNKCYTLVVFHLCWGGVGINHFKIEDWNLSLKCGRNT